MFIKRKKKENQKKWKHLDRFEECDVGWKK